MSDSKQTAEAAVVGHARHDHRLLRQTLKISATTALVVYCVAATGYLGLRYVLLPRIDDFRPRIETIVSEKLHANVRITRLAPHWLGYEPGIDVTGLTIRDSHGDVALAVPQATATVSWTSLVRGKPVLSSLIVEKPDVLVARATDGSLSIAGVQVPTTHKGNDTFSTWLLSQQAIVLRGGTLRWRDAKKDAPELALRDIRVAILNNGFEHRIALQAPAEGTLFKGPLDFRARFHHRALHAIGKPQNWTGQAYVSTGTVDLPTLARYVDLPLKMYAGGIDNAIWASFSGGHLRSAHGELQGYDVALRVRPAQPKLDVPIAHFGWALDIDPQREYRLRLTNLLAELGQPPLADGTPVVRTLALKTLTGRYRIANVEHGQLMSVTGDRVDLGVLAEFSRALPVPPRFLNVLVRFDPRGLVENYTFELERARPENETAASEQRVSGAAPIIRYRVKGDLQGISVAAQEPPPGLSPTGHPRAGLPGFENLRGSIDADQTHGTITLDAVNAGVTIPGVFDDPRLKFDRLRGRGQWTVAPAVAPGERHKAFTVSVPELSVENEDTAGSITATYANPGHGRGSLDLVAKIAHAKVPSIPRYLPTSIREHLRHYLGHGLQSGLARDATIEVHGRLDKFPYSRDPKAGVFRIVAPFSGGKFDPSPYPPKTLKNGTPNVWPALDGIRGVFALNENVLRFDVDRAHYKRVALTHVEGHIDDLGNRASNFIIDGKAQGPLADLLDYLNHSAVAGMTGHFGEQLRASGPATLALTLTVPRKQQPPHTSVAGTVRLEGNMLAAPNVPPVEQLTGRVHFTEHTLSLERVAGRWLGGDVHANGGLAASGAYAFDVGGHVAADSARELELRGPASKLLQHVYGDAPYSVSVRGARGGSPRFAVTSDLSSLALDLPAPLGKPLGAPMAFSFSLEPLANTQAPHEANAGDEHLERADLRLGPIEAAYELRREANAPHGMPEVVRGAISVNRPVQLPSEGVSATAQVASFDAEAWRALARELRTAPADRPTTSAGDSTASRFLPDRYALRFDTLKLLNRQWDNVVVDASRTGRDWQADIASNEVAGNLSWQPGAANAPAGVLRARFAKAAIPATVGHDLVGQLSAAPRQTIPAIDLVVDQLTVHGHELGRLAVDARNFDEDGMPVWQLDKLELTNPAAHLVASANWRTPGTTNEDGDPSDESGMSDSPRRTAIDFKLDVSDVGALLDRLGLPRTVKAGSGSLQGNFGWRGGPTAIDYPTLNGHLALDVQHGQILKVDPGVAKLLGVLSLQSLTRVLTLNFKDVMGEGLPFERATGTGDITNGIGRTNDVRVITAPARADISGTVDLAQETQDMRIKLTPTINAGSAVIAATVVNPLLGLGALVANVALSQSISHAFAHEYTVTGSWAHPHIERVAVDRGKMAAPADATGR